MDNREAVNWLINISADIGKAEHSDLWHYEQALTEIKDMLEYAQLSQEGTTSDTIQPKVIIGHWIQYNKRFPWKHHYKCSVCGNYLDFSGVNGGRGEVNYCPNCGAKMTISK